MERRDNDFLFTNINKSQAQNQQKVLQKIREEKEQMKVNKVKEEKSLTIQRYLHGFLSRQALRRKFQTDFAKNLQDLEKLSVMVWQKKNEMLYLPLKSIN